MPTPFRNLFDSIIAALGGGYDKPPRPPDPETRRPPSRQVISTNTAADPAVTCHVCGVRPVKPEFSNEYCGANCILRQMEQDLADRMDVWHDQFQARFGDD
ncbi:MAG TPA: hypothetical protein VF703_16780 [Pyrinomonadaceae bacterium]|jgi:hypothetical protein